MSSAHTDGKNPSVNTDGMLRIKKKEGGSLMWRLLRVFFTDGITEGFKTSAPYGDETDSPMQMPTESLRDSKRQLRTVTRPIHRCKCRWNHRGIQNSSSVRWRALFTVRIADRITDGIFRRWIRQQKLIHPLSLDPILPYFSFFFSFFFLSFFFLI